MPSLHDELMGPAAEELAEHFGERDGAGLSEKAVTLYDPHGKPYESAAVIGQHTLDEDGADPVEGAQEWGSRGERLDVRLMGTSLEVTDRWSVDVAAHPGVRWSVERVERFAGGLLLRLGREPVERIQRSGYE